MSEKVKAEMQARINAGRYKIPGSDRIDVVGIADDIEALEQKEEAI